MQADFVKRAAQFVADLPINNVNLGLLSQHYQQLVPFVGAGLSADFGYPSWHSLIQGLAAPIGLNREVELLLSESKMEEAAELVCTAAPNLFDDTFQQVFNVEKLPQPLPSSAVRHLPSIATGIVLTTNFDHVLELTFDEAHQPFREIFSGVRIRRANRAVQLNERCLLKLHGDYRDSDSRIITAADYTREYGSIDPDKLELELPIPRVLAQALTARPLIFLGCSLRSDRTLSVINNLVRRYPTVMHFALLSSDDMTPKRVKQLYAWNIRPIYYKSGDFASIDPFLESLALLCRGTSIRSFSETPAARVSRTSPTHLTNELKGLTPESLSFPANIENAINEQIYRQPFYRAGMIFDIVIRDQDRETLVFTTTFSYTVVNRTATVQTYGATYSFFGLSARVLELNVNDHSFDPEQPEFRDGRGIRFPISLEPQQSATVYMKVEEVWPETGTRLCISQYASTDLRVRVQSHSLVVRCRFEVLYFWKVWPESVGTVQEVVFDSGILPFQGVRLYWRPEARESSQESGNLGCTQEGAIQMMKDADAIVERPFEQP